MMKPARVSWTIAIFSVIVLASSGCATKKYVNQQISPVNQRLNQYEKQTEERLAWLNNKQQSDIAQVNERIAATDQRLSQVAQVANAAKASAEQANQTNMASRSTEEMEIEKSANSAVASALNYQIVDRADVMFGFDKADLSKQAQATLDGVVTKFQAQPRGVIELAGFTDPRGTYNYNLGLSRRRAWAVQRYLVQRNVPLRSIHVVGMGEGTPPQDLEPANPPAKASADRKERYEMDRRVSIRVFGAGQLSSDSGSGQ
jgi:outer membrane protein OmpA-like peptidoglycan-associated protein